MTVDQMIRRLRETKGMRLAHEMLTDEKGFAFLIGLSVRTVRRHRAAGEGPRCYYTNRWQYELCDIESFEAAGAYGQYLKRSPDNVGQSRPKPDKCGQSAIGKSINRG